MTDPIRTEKGLLSGWKEPGQANASAYFETSKLNTRLAIVVVTRNRRESLLRTLEKLTSLEAEYPIVVVDNASEDDTVSLVKTCFPSIKLIALETNRGAVARNLGVELMSQPYVAFADDDSWWEYGSLSQAIEFFENYPRLGLIMSKILVEPGGRYDPCCQSMEESPLSRTLNLPGMPVLGFIACGAVVRRTAFLAAGGFNPSFGTWGEEGLLSMDMARNGWGLSYIPTVISHHQPSKVRENKHRKIQEVRNNLWTCWLRRSPLKILRLTGNYLKDALQDRDVMAGLTAAFRGAGWAFQKRVPVPLWLENQLEIKESYRGNC